MEPTNTTTTIENAVAALNAWLAANPDIARALALARVGIKQNTLTFDVTLGREDGDPRDHIEQVLDMQRLSGVHHLDSSMRIIDPDAYPHARDCF